MSSVTIYCRDGACNVEGHTSANCQNRAAALRPPAREASVIRYQQQGMTCGSCRAYAVAAVMVDGKMYATTCARHRDLWIKRANACRAGVP